LAVFQSFLTNIILWYILFPFWATCSAHRKLLVIPVVVLLKTSSWYRRLPTVLIAHFRTFQGHVSLRTQWRSDKLSSQVIGFPLSLIRISHHHHTHQGLGKCFYWKSHCKLWKEVGILPSDQFYYSKFASQWNEATTSVLINEISQLISVYNFPIVQVSNTFHSLGNRHVCCYWHASNFWHRIRRHSLHNKLRVPVIHTMFPITQ
jgi:hypothetical protein